MNNIILIANWKKKVTFYEYTTKLENTRFYNKYLIKKENVIPKLIRKHYNSVLKDNYIKFNQFINHELYSSILYDIFNFAFPKYPRFFKKHLRIYKYYYNCYDGYINKRVILKKINDIYGFEIDEQLYSFLKQKYDLPKEFFDLLDYLLSETEINKEIKKKEMDDLFNLCLNYINQKPIHKNKN